MKVVIAGGTTQAEFLVSMFKDKKNELIIINPSESVADTILKRYHVHVYVGDPWRRYALEESNAYDADIFVSLCPSDTDNYASCIMAKKCFNARKCICVVNNPKNVDVYKNLGIDSVISSSYLLGQSVRSESSVENIMKTMSVENDRIVMIEAVVLSKYAICGHTLKEIRFPRYCSVSAVYRTPDVIIPNGDTLITAKDQLLIVCAPEDKDKVTKFIQREVPGKAATELIADAVSHIIPTSKKDKKDAEATSKAIKAEEKEEAKAEAKAKKAAEKEARKEAKKAASAPKVEEPEPAPKPAEKPSDQEEKADSKTKAKKITSKESK